MGINLTKEESVNRINLNKEQVAALCAKNNVLSGLTSRVGLVLDFSGSMCSLYQNGTVQAVVEKILPLAMQFDDNGEMECWLFSNNGCQLPNITLNNFYGFITNETKRYRMGGTCYEPVLNDIQKYYCPESFTANSANSTKGFFNKLFNNKKTTSDKSTSDKPALPVFIIFITDGDNSDYSETISRVTEMSRLPVFLQFIGIGSDRFSFLEKLDNMSGRYVDNANFLQVKTMGDITYEALLAEYPSWLENAKVKDMLK